MFRTLRNAAVALLSIATIIAVPLSVPALVAAQATGSGANIQQCLGQGSTLTAPSGLNCSNASVTSSTTSVNSIIKTTINIFSFVVGVVAVIMIIFGGFRYITSGGDSGNISSAKNTIIYAIIGLVVVAFAQIIVQFVLTKVTSGP